MSTFFPAHDPTPADLMRKIREMEAEIRQLRAQSQGDPVLAQRRTEVVFSYHGAVLPGDPSGQYLMKDFSAIIHRLDITSRTAPTIDAEYQVLVDNSPAYTGVVPAGEAMEVVNDLAIEVEEYSTLAVVFTEPGDIDTVVMTFQVVATDDEAFD